MLDLRRIILINGTSIENYSKEEEEDEKGVHNNY
jgi:hypothetical protein